jgi:hypothetical protein
MNLRRWMMITGLFALLMGSERLVSRRACFLRRAEAWASRVHDYSENRGLICLKEESLDPERRSIYLDRMRDLSATLERKYRTAASRPWLRVDPDRPFPEP